MKKITVSVSALFLALGVLSGCGEKKEEAPKAEAPAAEQKPVEQAAAPEATNPMKAMTDAASSAAGTVTDAAKATADAAAGAVDATKQAATDAVDATKQAAGDAVDATKQAASDVAAAAAPVDGEKVYKSLCFSCHDMGIAGSPKMGDKADWGPRIAKGADALHKSAIAGKNDVAGKVMPAKGGNPALSDDEVKAAVDFMMSKNK